MAPTLAGFTLGAIAGQFIAGVPLLSVIAGVPLCGAMAGCNHCWMPSLLDASGVHDCRGCHGRVPLLDAIARKIDQSVTPFSAAPFSTLITHKLACAIWGLCWYNFYLYIHLYIYIYIQTFFEILREHPVLHSKNRRK